VPGGNLIGTHADGVIQKCLELDLGIAQHVGVWRTTGAVFMQERCEHPFLVLSRKIYRFKLNADNVCNSDRVNKVLPRRAVLIAIVVLPVFHE